MSKKTVSEMSIQELEKYREQLSEELTVVNFYLRQKMASARKSTDSGTEEVSLEET